MIPVIKSVGCRNIYRLTGFSRHCPPSVHQAQMYVSHPEISAILKTSLVMINITDLVSTLSHDKDV